MTLIIRLSIVLTLIISCSFMDKQNLIVIKNSIAGYPQNIVTEEIFSQQKFSFVEVSFGRGPAALLSLRSTENDVYKWLSSDGAIIYTYKGLILETAGLEHNVKTNYRSFEFGEPLIQNVNFLNPPLYGIDLNLALIKSSQQLIKKGWFYLDTTEVHISKEIPFLRWRTVDKFWINAESKRIEKTIQNIHPKLPPVTLTFYYK